MEEATTLGPLAKAPLRDAILQQGEKLREAGAEELFRGKVPSPKGYFVPPMVVRATKDTMQTLRNEEIFGPLAVVTEVENIDEAIRLANASRYGLGSAVFTRDAKEAERAVRTLDAGLTFINEMVVSEAALPFGGVKASGIGRELGTEGLLEWVSAKSVAQTGFDT